MSREECGRMNPKIFESISFAANTVASRVDELAANTYELLTSAAKEFHQYSTGFGRSNALFVF